MDSSRRNGALLVIAAATLWSTGGVGVKTAVAEPMVIAGLRSVFALAFMAIVLGVVLRRAIPLLTAAGLVLAAFIVPRFIGEQALFTQLLVLSAPPVLLALGFSLQSMARFEIPPWPRPLGRAAWWR